MIDSKGNRLNVGDRIVWAAQLPSTVYLRTGRVAEVDVDFAHVIPEPKRGPIDSTQCFRLTRSQNILLLERREGPRV